MNRLVLIALMCLPIEMAHASAGRRATPTPSPSPTPIASVTPSPTPFLTGSLKVINLKCDSTCTGIEAAELPAIESAMNRSLMSQCFENYFLSRKRIDMTQGFSNAAIVQILRKPVDLTMSYYEDKPTVYGYESASDFKVIHLNRVAAKNFTTCKKASVSLHEMSHGKGFFHRGNRANPNYYTVPFTANHANDSVDDFGEKQSDYGGCCE